MTGVDSTSKPSRLSLGRSSNCSGAGVLFLVPLPQEDTDGGEENEKNGEEGAERPPGEVLFRRRRCVLMYRRGVIVQKGIDRDTVEPREKAQVLDRWDCVADLPAGDRLARDVQQLRELLLGESLFCAQGG